MHGKSRGRLFHKKPKSIYIPAQAKSHVTSGLHVLIHICLTAHMKLLPQVLPHLMKRAGANGCSYKIGTSGFTEVKGRSSVQKLCVYVSECVRRCVSEYVSELFV